MTIEYDLLKKKLDKVFAIVNDEFYDTVEDLLSKMTTKEIDMIYEHPVLKDLDLLP